MADRFHITEVLVGPLPDDIDVVHGTEIEQMWIRISELAHSARPYDLAVSVSGRIADAVELYLQPPEEPPLSEVVAQARDVLADRITKWLGDDWRVYYYADKLLLDLDTHGLGVFPVDADGSPYIPDPPGGSNV